MIELDLHRARIGQFNLKVRSGNNKSSIKNISLQFKKKKLLDFLVGLNELEIEAYKNDVCKVDCTRYASDLEIAQEIWLMTARTHDLNIEGHKMLQNGLPIR